ncbi:DUF6542 domain-containing protein [Streptomyces albidoflavus]|uniref:DUF6542 domain-containing protein n=1 Tax=Streptomyces albidoflavus TaxID=1886 RepID=UPI0033D22105
MEQPSTSAQQARRPAPLPAQGSPADARPPAAPGPRRGQDAARAVRLRPGRPGRPGRDAARPRGVVRRMPRPRLTGLGAGLLSTAAMVVAGAVAWLLPAGAQTVAFGVLFLPVCALTGLWVRPADLAMGPVVVPLAYAIGVLPVAEGGGAGFTGQVMGLVTTLALNAGWLYGGTLVAGVIVTVRKVRLMSAARRKARSAPRRPAAEQAAPRTDHEAGPSGRRAPRSRVAP